MRTPTTTTRGHIQATLIVPQTDAVTRFKATIPLADNTNRMLAPLYAELIQRGTKKHTRKTFADALEQLGAELSVSVGQSGITISGRALSQTLPAFLHLVKEMLDTPTFPPKEISQVHTQYLQALHDEADNARTRAYHTFTQTLYPKTHPYYKPSVAERRTALKKVTRKTYLDFHARLRATPLTLGISGTPDAQKQILALFTPDTAQSESAGARHAPLVPLHKAVTVYQSVPGKANVELYIGNTLPLTLADPAYLPFQFGLSILGKWGGFSGRLMSTVREKEGLTYTIYARTEGVTTNCAGAWYIFTFFTPKDLERGIASTVREIQTIVKKGVAETEMTRFKELLKNQFVLAHESDAKTLSLYHDALCAGLSATDVAAQHDAIAHLTQKQVNRALTDHLHPDALVISGAGPVVATP